MRARVLLGLLLLAACSRDSSLVPTRAVSLSPAHMPLPPFEAGATTLIETIYDGGYRGDWGDWGWAKREVNGPGPAKVNFTAWGGWILVKQGFAPPPLGRLVFRVKPPDEPLDYLQVKIAGSEGEGPDVKVAADEIAAMPPPQDGWSEVQVPVAELNPDGLPFDRVIIHASRHAKDSWTLLDHVGFTAGGPEAPKRRTTAASFPAASIRSVSASIACGARATRISPRIYGIAYSVKQDYQWHMGTAIRRWGGNPSSRYNWKISAYNLDQDWFFENKGIPSYRQFLDEDATHGVESALTVPMIGWVAKDTTSVGFPVDPVGPQERTDPYLPSAGNGKGRDGKDIAGGPESRTSVPAPPEWIKSWVSAIRADDADAGRRSVAEYILDNEPSLWHVTHRDIRHEPLGYDELVERTIAYGTAIRQADPDAVIAGPAEWGWLGYEYSGKDSQNNWAKTDRRAHGDVPLTEYYLRKLREYEQKTGIRVLDVLDFHYYPQSEGVFGGGEGGTDEKTNALRIRSTRSLWDPKYTDESWIKENIRLLPRMKEWIDADYPGRQISVGEWNFGGASNMSGALATAEALGRFAQFGVGSAFYWTVPPEGSPTMQAFIAYRNFDGKGGRFLDWYLPTQSGDDTMVSLFASRDDDGKHIVLVLLNLSSTVPVDAKIDVSSCGALATRQSYAYYRGAHGLAAGDTVPGPAPVVEQFLPPYSITVLDVILAAPMAGTVAK